MARVSDLAIGQSIEQPQDASIQVAGDIQIYVPLKGLVDVAKFQLVPLFMENA